jgi:type IV pilus assembly protein PilA
MQNIQSMKQSVQKGFTLIELMIVVAIIGILAALAIPAYQDYTIKSRVGEGASLSGAFKTGLEVYWSENGTLSGIVDGLNTATLGLTAVQGQYVSTVQFYGTGPTIEVGLKTETKLGPASQTCFTYIPSRPTVGGNLIWTISAVCPGIAQTAIDAKYLPRT